MFASSVVPPQGDVPYGTTWAADVIRTGGMFRRGVSILSGLLSTLLAGIKVGALAYEAFDWLHAIVVLW